MLVSVTNLFLAGLISPIAIAIWLFVRNRFLSPLRHVPGPLIASLTEYWLVFIDLAGIRTTTIHQLHQKYGPTVRIGPNEVSFADVSIVREIYSQKTVFMKAPVYETMSVKPLGIFSLRNKADHSRRRSLLSHAFSQANLDATRPLIQGRVDRLVGIVEENRGRSLDVLKTFRLFALDVVGELFLGAPFNAMDMAKAPQFLEDMDRHFLLSGLEANFPWLYIMLWTLPNASLRSFLSARQRLIEYGHTAYTDYISRFGKDSGRKDLLTKILSPKSESASMSEQETYTEISNLVFAGTDTTSTTLTYLFWELTRHPVWQTRVREEIADNQGATSVAAKKVLYDLPLLDAIIQEALRLHPAAPASLQRIAPNEGAVLSSYQIPGNTVVSMQCYTTHRDPNAFPDPEAFNPDRWMDANGVTDDMKELFMPFSRGTRACLGKSLAMMELKLVTATLLERYQITAPPTTTSQSMEMRDHFLVLPVDGRCDLIFSRIITAA